MSKGSETIQKWSRVQVNGTRSSENLSDEIKI